MDDFAEQKTSNNRVRFYRKPKPDKVASAKEGRPIVKMVEYIQIMGGDLRNIPDKPVHDGHRRMYAKQYQAFLADKDQDSASGTLLSAAGFVSPERVEELKHFKVYTVEQLGDLPDSALSQMGMHTRKERECARDYLKTAKGFAPVAQLRHEMESKGAETQEQGQQRGQHKGGR
jgi:hypothetical protein